MSGLNIAEIIQSAGTEILVGLVVLALTTLATWLSSKLPSRNLWRLSDPRRMIICVAQSSETETEKYVRPATGIGQVRALAAIAPSLNRAYGHLNTDNIRLSTDLLGDSREADLISLGGSKNNEVTRDVLEMLAEAGYEVPRSERSMIVWSEGRKGGKAVFEAETRDGQVVRDYGLIVRAPNPFRRGRTIVVLAGASTYGTVAAARFFTERCRFRLGSFAAVVSAPVRDRHTLEPELLHFRKLAKTKASS